MKNTILITAAMFLALSFQAQAAPQKPSTKQQTPSTPSKIKPIKLFNPLKISIGGMKIGPTIINPARKRITTPQKDVKLKPAPGIGIKFNF